VGRIGLINAVDRFDPERGVKFTTYATPTILGEIRRYFRDKGWTMKVPRRLQELCLDAAKVVDELTSELGRFPTVAEIAERLGLAKQIAYASAGSPFYVTVVPAEETGETKKAAEGGIELPV